MKAKILAISLIAVLALTLSRPATVSVGATLTVAPQPAETDSTQAKVTEALRYSPVMFIQNVSQFDGRARFQVRGIDKIIWLAEDGIWVMVMETSPHAPSQGGRGEVRSLNLRFSFPGSNLRIEPFNRLDTVVSYFIGNDPAKWHVAVPVWGGVRYVDLYPGVDLELTGENGQVVPRLVAHPGADLSAVRLRVEGAEEVALGRGGGLLLRTALGDFTLPLFQVERGSAEPALVQRVDSLAFEVSHPFTAGNVAVSGPSSMVHSQQAVSLLYSGFLGGSAGEYGLGIAVDSSGNAYVTGWTASPNFPVAVGPYTDFISKTEVFVAKVSASGKNLVYSGFLGGSEREQGNSIAVDSNGNAYVTGWTESSNFPVEGWPYTELKGVRDAFVAKVKSDGTGLVYSGFLGGSGGDYGQSIAVDSNGNAYVTGSTESSDDFPVKEGPYTSHNGKFDAFVVKSDGTGLVYSGFLGGSENDEGRGIAIDSSGNAYVTGGTFSSDFPVKEGPDTSHNGNWDAFVAKVDASGKNLVYSGFLGGSDMDEGLGIAVDSFGNAYVTGYTFSSAFPTKEGPDTSYNDGGDAFVAKVKSDGTGLVYSGFLGGSGSDRGWGIAVDSFGNAYITGDTWSSDFPAIVGPDLDFNGGYYDAFVAKVGAVWRVYLPLVLRNYR